MIDAKKARAQIDTLREAIRLRKVDPKLADVDRWLVLDGVRRDLQGKIDALNSEKKELAKLGRENPDAARAKGVELREASRALEAEMARNHQFFNQKFNRPSTRARTRPGQARPGHRCGHSGAGSENGPKSSILK